MFKRSGTSVKSLALIILFLYIIAGFIAGFVIGVLIKKVVLCLIISLAISTVFGWLNSIALYCLGDIWEQVDSLRKELNGSNSEYITHSITEKPNTFSNQPSGISNKTIFKEKTWKCPKCDRVNPYSSPTCIECGCRPNTR